MNKPNRTITAAEAENLVSWYRMNRRHLPWRDTGDPYDIWISEIMLQQTRAETVIRYFLRFKAALPTLDDLCVCDPDRLMKLWEGLGYYSRARNLQKAAQIIRQEYAGCLPASREALMNLPGIGSYTAGAIAAQAYGIPEPAVDGNVLRILARLLAIEDDIRAPSVKREAESLIWCFYQSYGREEIDRDPSFVTDFTQGLMELGALICVPGASPRCGQCPWQDSCLAHKENRTDTLPFRSRPARRKIDERTVLVIRDGDRFLLHKRPDHGLLAGLYEFVNVDGHLSRSRAIHYAESLGATVLHVHVLPEAVHIFTHLEWHMIGYEIRIADLDQLTLPGSLLMTKKELQQYAVPSVFEAYMDEYRLR